MPGWVPRVTWDMYFWTKSIELVLFSKGKALQATQGLTNIVIAWRQYQLLRWMTPFYILFYWQSKSHNGSFQMISEFLFLMSLNITTTLDLYWAIFNSKKNMLDLSPKVHLFPSSFYSHLHKFLIFYPPLSGVLTDSSLMTMCFNLSKVESLYIATIGTII